MKIEFGPVFLFLSISYNVTFFRCVERSYVWVYEHDCPISILSCWYLTHTHTFAIYDGILLHVWWMLTVFILFNFSLSFCSIIRSWKLSNVWHVVFNCLLIFLPTIYTSDFIAGNKVCVWVSFLFMIGWFVLILSPFKHSHFDRFYLLNKWIWWHKMYGLNYDPVISCVLL